MVITNKRIPWIQWFLLASTILLGVEVMFLVRQNRELEAILALHTPVEQLKSGDTVEPIKVRSLDGGFLDISYDDPEQRYLFFVFSTTCPHCEATLVYWNSIVSTIKAKNCTVIGISVDDSSRTSRFISSNDIRFYVGTVSPADRFNTKYKIGGYPQTILVNGGASVENVWSGELSVQQVEEIISSIGG
jgi:peroxiredoxin